MSRPDSLAVSTCNSSSHPPFLCQVEALKGCTPCLKQPSCCETYGSSELRHKRVRLIAWQFPPATPSHPPFLCQVEALKGCTPCLKQPSCCETYGSSELRHKRVRLIADIFYTQSNTRATPTHRNILTANDSQTYLEYYSWTITTLWISLF